MTPRRLCPDRPSRLLGLALAAVLAMAVGCVGPVERGSDDSTASVSADSSASEPADRAGGAPADSTANASAEQQQLMELLATQSFGDEDARWEYGVWTPGGSGALCATLRLRADAIEYELTYGALAEGCRPGRTAHVVVVDGMAYQRQHDEEAYRHGAVPRGVVDAYLEQIDPLHMPVLLEVVERATQVRSAGGGVFEVVIPVRELMVAQGDSRAEAAEFLGRSDVELSLEFDEVGRLVAYDYEYRETDLIMGTWGQWSRELVRSDPIVPPGADLLAASDAHPLEIGDAHGLQALLDDLGFPHIV